MGSLPSYCFVYVGSYGSEREPTIHVFKLNLQDGSFELVQECSEVAQASWLVLHPNGRFLYAVSERGDTKAETHGAAGAFRRDPATGKISFLNEQSAEASGPCYIDIHPSGRLVALANYVSGSITVLPVLDDGVLGKAIYGDSYSGNSIVPERQENPHAHSTVFDPSGHFLFAQDLGTDQMHQYVILEDGTLRPSDPPSIRAEAGSGPRHLVFHPEQPYAYVSHELNNTVAAYHFHRHNGQLAAMQTVSMLPAGFTGESHAADIHLTPDGSYLYASNRGHDSIMAWEVDSENGHLTPIGDFPSGGATPRGFGIDPSGRWLIVANQESNSLVSMRIDWSTGELIPYQGVQVRQPVCVVCALPAPTAT